MKKINILAFLLLLLSTGCGGPAHHVQTSQVQIYRTAPMPDPAVALCRQLKLHADQSGIHNKAPALLTPWS